LAVAAEKVVVKLKALVLTAALLCQPTVAAVPQAPPPSTVGPTRIVSLVPAVTEMLFAMGAGSTVVAVSSFDRYPPEARTRPSVGALVDPDVERILSLKPDLVVTYGSQKDLVERLQRSSLPVFSYRHTGLADIAATVRELGARIGRKAEADRLANQIDRDLLAVRSRVAALAPPSSLLVFSREPGSLRGVFASGGVGFLNDLLELAGGRNVFADVKRESVQVSSEQLLVRSPAVIVELQPSGAWPEERLARERDAWKTLSSIPAVRNGRIHILTDDKFTIPGPRVAETARAIADALHGPR
jgi:iron complex transport system substrate-binding protein